VALVGVYPVPNFLITREHKMEGVAIFFVCMFLLVGVIIVMDDGQWDRKK
jgi:hypothetical protein